MKIKKVLSYLNAKPMSSKSRSKIFQQKISNAIKNPLLSYLTAEENPHNSLSLHKSAFSRQHYLQSIEETKEGDAVNFVIENSSFVMISSDYSNLGSASVYKMLNYVKPDLIILPMKPDLLLGNIDSTLVKLYNDKISFQKYMADCVREGWELQTSLQEKESVKKSLLKQGILLNKNKFNSEEIVEKQSKFSELNLEDNIITSKTLSTVSLWSEINSTEILLGDLPESSFLENLAYKISLVELKEMHEKIFTETPLNPDFLPNSSYGTALNLFPELFFQDAYTAGLLHMIAQQKKYSNVLVFTQNGQTKSIPTFLTSQTNQSGNSLLDLIKGGKRWSGLLLGEDSLEILIEKWVLLTLILKGISISLKINHKSPSISFLINKYAHDEYVKTGFNSRSFLKQRMNHLFDSLMQERLAYSLSFLTKGYRAKQQDFMKKIIDDPFLSSQI